MKKAAKIVLLVVLLAMVGVIVYAVMVWPVNPTRMKPAKSYEQLRDTVEKKTDIRVPGEKLLPWTVTERQLRMDGPSRLAKVSGFAISGTMERGRAYRSKNQKAPFSSPTYRYPCSRRRFSARCSLPKSVSNSP